MSVPVLDDDTIVVTDESTNEDVPCQFVHRGGVECGVPATHIGMCLRCGWSANYCTEHAIWLASHRISRHIWVKCPGCARLGHYPENWAIDTR